MDICFEGGWLETRRTGYGGGYAILCAWATDRVRHARAKQMRHGGSSVSGFPPRSLTYIDCEMPSKTRSTSRPHKHH